MKKLKLPIIQWQHSLYARDIGRRDTNLVNRKASVASFFLPLKWRHKRNVDVCVKVICWCSAQYYLTLTKKIFSWVEFYQLFAVVGIQNWPHRLDLLILTIYKKNPFRQTEVLRTSMTEDHVLNSETTEILIKNRPENRWKSNIGGVYFVQHLMNYRIEWCLLACFTWTENALICVLVCIRIKNKFSGILNFYSDGLLCLQCIVNVISLVTDSSKF